MKIVIFKRFDQKSGNCKHLRLSFVQYWRLGRVRNTKFGMNASNEKLFNAAMLLSLLNVTIVFEIKRKSTRGGVKYPLPLSLGLSRLATSEAAWRESLQY